MSVTEFFDAPDGTTLLRRKWPATGTGRAAVLLVHGLGEHSGRYGHVGEHLAAHGLTVQALDLRGFGGSQGTRAYVEHFDDYLDDLAGEVRSLREPGVPVVLFGHSLGGLIALSYVGSDRPRPDLLVLSAPALEANLSGIKKLAARVLGRVAPKLALPNDITGAQLSRDPSVGEAYFADPLVVTATTTRLGAESLGAMAAARDRLVDGIGIPTLVLHGGADTLVPTASSEALGRLEGVERIVFDGFRHECHNEEGGTVMLRVLTEWLDHRI